MIFNGSYICIDIWRNFSSWGFSGVWLCHRMDRLVSYNCTCLFMRCVLLCCPRCCTQPSRKRWGPPKVSRRGRRNRKWQGRLGGTWQVGSLDKFLGLPFQQLTVSKQSYACLSSSSTTNECPRLRIQAFQYTWGLRDNWFALQVNRPRITITY